VIVPSPADERDRAAGCLRLACGLDPLTTLRSCGAAGLRGELGAPFGYALEDDPPSYSRGYETCAASVYAALRSPSIRRSQETIWFQLAKVRVTSAIASCEG
jgi:hypothetical protein